MNTDGRKREQGNLTTKSAKITKRRRELFNHGFHGWARMGKRQKRKAETENSGEFGPRIGRISQMKAGIFHMHAERVKVGSVVFAEFHALRLTEPRSVAGRGARFQSVSERNIGTGWGKTNSGRCGSTALPGKRPPLSRPSPPGEKGNGSTGGWTDWMTGENKQLTAKAPEGWRTTRRCAWINVCQRAKAGGRPEARPIANRRYSGRPVRATLPGEATPPDQGLHPTGSLGGLPQISQRAGPTVSQSAGLSVERTRQPNERSAGLETRDTADLEVCGTKKPPRPRRRV
jgi:hypothetical protein